MPKSSFFGIINPKNHTKTRKNLQKWFLKEFTEKIISENCGVRLADDIMDKLDLKYLFTTTY